MLLVHGPNGGVSESTGTEIHDRLDGLNGNQAQHQRIVSNPMLSTRRRTPQNLRFRQVELDPVELHPRVCVVVDESRRATLQLGRVARTTEAIDLGV